MKVCIGFLLILFFNYSYADWGYLKKGAPKTGSHIPSKTITSNLSFDKGYMALSEAEKALVRADYEDLPDGDNPPYPLTGIGRIYQVIGGAHQNNHWTGKLFIIATIDRFGNVKEIVAHESPNKRLTRIVEKILNKTKFSPGTCSGKPCEMEFLVHANLDATL